MGKHKPPEPRTLTLGDPGDLKGELKVIGGSQCDHWNRLIADQVVNSIWLKSHDAETRQAHVSATVYALMGIAPKDELEAMIGAQLLACHHAAMECYRRAMHPEQTFEGRKENLNQANKLSRTHTALLEALNRHRGKGQQKVTVEHVHVHEGGQAIVGNVTHPGGGDASEMEDQPHGKQVANAPEPALSSDLEAEREAVPVPGGAR